MAPQASSGVAGLRVQHLSIPQYNSLKLNSHFPGALDPLMMAYNESIHFDRAFYAQDIAGSIAYARANVATGILTNNEFAAIEGGLRQVLEEWRNGTFLIKSGVDEDIHTANERRLGEIIGTETAGKLHTYVR